MTDLWDQWRSGGELIDVTVRGVTRRIFVRTTGSGPVVVLLHGFPSSSLEWSAIEPVLAAERTVLSVDFLGYGASEKPPGHRYSVFEQADLVAAVLAARGVTRAHVAAYDYGGIVLSELLARGADAGFGPTGATFLNGGLIAEHYRPRLVQRAALVPGLGRLLARAYTESVFRRSWAEVFSAEHPLDHDLAATHYRALRAGDPDGDVHRRLLAYIPERAAHRERWEQAIFGADVPVSFLWGMRDPVAGAHMAQAITERSPGADLVEYPDAGHCPHLEIPHRVAADLLARTS
ncbi:alpha/beta fold hydrolase [Nocardia sp. NPDC060249]|uniref:alpha/beta fold hydrolase n=1 Tax=Nocardia sp. NPDC060249 TaxID=3347082 RepID=UPI0036507BCF